MGAYDDEGGDGLVEPAVLLEQVAEDDAGAEQRHEEVDGDHGRVVRGAQRAAQPRQLRRKHLEPHPAAACSGGTRQRDSAERRELGIESI